MTFRFFESAPIIRKLGCRDANAIRDHLMRLDHTARSSRFGGTVGDDFVIGYAKRVIDPDAVVFGAFMHGVLCAIGELRGLQQSGAREAEVAVSVETDWQGRGIGGDLFARLVNASQNRGVRALNVLYMSGNSRMKSIAGKHSPELFTDSGQIEARFSLPWATPLSIAREMIGDVCAAARCSVTELVFGRHRLTA